MPKRPTTRTDAHRKADQKYRQKRVRVPIDFDPSDPDFALLEQLAEKHGSRKAAIVAGLRLLKQQA